ncbi:MAG: heme-binding domain-containing protein [Candidatus Limnocylindria bacterium]
MSLRRLILGLFLVGVVGFLAIQLVPYGRDHANPPVTGEPKWDSPATRAYAVTACFDCHSNQTQWPWYSNIAPMSWLIQHDVDEGRDALNWSTWGAGHGESESAEAVSEGNMPPFVYLIAHPNANFSQADKDAFIRGLIATFGAGGN